MSDTVLDVGTDGILVGQHVEVFTVLSLAEQQRDDLVKVAADNDDTDARFRVYQLVEPGSVPGELVLDAEPRLDLGQQIRLEAARIAAGLHAEVGIDEHEHPVLTASEFAAFIADGTVPADEDAEPTPPDIVVRGTNSGPRTVEILVDGEMVAYVLLIYRNGDEGDDDLRCSISAGGGISTEEEIGAALRLAVSCLPDAPTIEIRRPHDDVLQVVIDGEVVAEANHDEHGWDGMDAVEKTALAVFRALGRDVVEAADDCDGTPEGDGEPGEARDTT